MEQAGSIFISFSPSVIETEAEVTDQVGTKLGPSQDQVTPEVTSEARRMQKPHRFLAS